MGRLFLAFLPNERIYRCKKCGIHISTSDDVISKSFHGQFGRAYLMHQVVNVSAGRQQERILITGVHVVSDIFCLQCESPLGWKYEEAYEESQKYKEGKYILERELVDHVRSDNCDCESP